MFDFVWFCSVENGIFGANKNKKTKPKSTCESTIVRDNNETRKLKKFDWRDVDRRAFLLFAATRRKNEKPFLLNIDDDLIYGLCRVQRRSWNWWKTTIENNLSSAGCENRIRNARHHKSQANDAKRMFFIRQMWIVTCAQDPTTEKRQGKIFFCDARRREIELSITIAFDSATMYKPSTKRMSEFGIRERKAFFLWLSAFRKCCTFSIDFSHLMHFNWTWRRIEKPHKKCITSFCAFQFEFFNHCAHRHSNL